MLAEEEGVKGEKDVAKKEDKKAGFTLSNLLKPLQGSTAAGPNAQGDGAVDQASYFNRIIFFNASHLKYLFAAVWLLRHPR